MTVEEAAKSLQERLQGESWLTAVGIGDNAGSPCIVVYIKTRKSVVLRFLENGWNGFPVVVRKMGTPRLVATFHPRAAKRRGDCP